MVRDEMGFRVGWKLVMAIPRIHEIKGPCVLGTEHRNPANAGVTMSSGVIALVLGKSSRVGMRLVVRKLFVGMMSRC